MKRSKSYHGKDSPDLEQFTNVIAVCTSCHTWGILTIKVDFINPITNQFSGRHDKWMLCDCNAELHYLDAGEKIYWG